MVEQKGNCNLAVKLSLLCLLLSWINTPLAAETTVVINKSYSESDPRYQYVYELLQKVVDVSESKYGRARLKQSSVLMSRDRVFASLLNGEELDIMAEALKPQWDRELLMVPVPIRKGVQGYRIFLIHKDHTDVMDGVTSL